MKGYPRIGDYIIIPESYKGSQTFKDYYHGCRDQLCAILGKPVEVVEVSKFGFTTESIGICVVANGENLFAIPLEVVEKVETKEAMTEPPRVSPAVNTKAKSLKIIYDEPPKAEMPQTEDWGLRDWVALSCIDAAYHHCRKTGKVEAKRIARYAYDLADAMLEERAQG